MAKRNGIIKTLIQIGLILVVLALIFFSLNSVLPGFIDVLANGQQSDVQEYLNSFHDFSGYAIGFLLQFIQIITIALPSVPIQVAVGVIFGTWRGFLVCYLGYVSANALIFISVRKLGAKLEQLLPGKPVEKTGSKKKNFITDAKYPAFSVFFASVLPVIPNEFDSVCCIKNENRFPLIYACCNDGLHTDGADALCCRRSACGG